MAEYIERDAAVGALTLHDCDSAGAKIAILDIPAADVAPVVHGRWNRPIISGSKRKNPFCYCTNCACPVQPKRMSKYCPNCGAKMDKEGADGLDSH